MGAHSTETVTALSELFPALHFVVQLSEPITTVSAVEAGKAREFSPRITVQKRIPGTQQTVNDAAVYILRVPAPLAGVASHSLPESESQRTLAELKAHLGVLRGNKTTVTLILDPRLLPEPGTVDPDVEAIARLRDLSEMQLTSECGMEMSEMVELVNSVHDSMGWLVVANRLRSRTSATVALSIKYQAYADRHHEAEPTIL